MMLLKSYRISLHSISDLDAGTNHASCTIELQALKRLHKPVFVACFSPTVSLQIDRSIALSEEHSGKNYSWKHLKKVVKFSIH